MANKYEVQCNHCKGRGVVEVAAEIYRNWQICDKVLPRFENLTSPKQAECMAILGGSNLLAIQQGRHIFNLNQLFQLAELFNCKVGDLIP